jgi:hypothetical protein
MPLAFMLPGFFKSFHLYKKIACPDPHQQFAMPFEGAYFQKD